MGTSGRVIVKAGIKQESSDSLADQTGIGVFAEDVFYESFDGRVYRLSDVLREIEASLVELGHVWRLSADQAALSASRALPGYVENGAYGITLAPGTEDDQSNHQIYE